MQNVKNSAPPQTELFLDHEPRVFLKEQETNDQRKIINTSNVIKDANSTFSLEIIAIAIVAVLLLISGLYLNAILFYTNGLIFIVLVDKYMKKKFFYSDDLDIEC